MDDLFKDRPEDVTWLCSLSESEIDMLINLKLLILHRVEVIDCEKLAEKFDLKMLRAIALVLVEYLKAQVKDLSLAPDVVKPTDFLDACNLLRCDHERVMSIEDLCENTGVDLQNIVRGPQVEVVPQVEVGSKPKKRKRRKCGFVHRKRRKLRKSRE